MTAYEQVATIYDDLMTDVDYDGWFAHYMGLLELGLPIQRVLELGCGTGNFTYRLARHFDVHAVDLSAQMLAQAQAKADHQAPSHDITWECADMAAFAAPGAAPFDAAVAVFDVMNCVGSFQQLTDACRNIAAHLKPSARFIFDVNTELAFKLHLFDEDLERPESGYSHVWRGLYDEQTRLEHVQMKYYHEGEQAFCEEHVQRAHSRHEIHEALTQAGFERIYFLDAVRMCAPDEHSDRWLVCATRRS